MAKLSALDKAIAVIEGKIEVLQQALAVIKAQQGTPTGVRRPRTVAVQKADAQ